MSDGKFTIYSDVWGGLGIKSHLMTLYPTPHKIPINLKKTLVYKKGKDDLKMYKR